MPEWEAYFYSMGVLGLVDTYHFYLTEVYGVRVCH